MTDTAQACGNCKYRQQKQDMERLVILRELEKQHDER